MRQSDADHSRTSRYVHHIMPWLFAFMTALPTLRAAEAPAPAPFPITITAEKVEIKDEGGAIIKTLGKGDQLQAVEATDKGFMVALDGAGKKTGLVSNQDATRIDTPAGPTGSEKGYHFSRNWGWYVGGAVAIGAGAAAAGGGGGGGGDEIVSETQTNQLSNPGSSTSIKPPGASNTASTPAPTVDISGTYSGRASWTFVMARGGTKSNSGPITVGITGHGSVIITDTVGGPDATGFMMDSTHFTASKHWNDGAENVRTYNGVVSGTRVSGTITGSQISHDPEKTGETTGTFSANR